MPRRVQEEQNLAVDAVERGGGISVPNAIDIVSVQLATILAGVISPDPTGNAFERKGKKILGTLIVLDLGARVGSIGSAFSRATPCSPPLRLPSKTIF